MARELPIFKVGRTEFLLDEERGRIIKADNPNIEQEVSPEVLFYMLSRTERRQRKWHGR